MSRNAWKLLRPASLAAFALLGGCQSPLFARVFGRPAAPVVPPPAAAAPQPAGASLASDLGGTGQDWRAPPRQPTRRRAHQARMRPPAARTPLAKDLPAAREPHSAAAAQQAMRTALPAGERSARPADDGPIVIQPAASAQRSMPDPPPRGAPAVAESGARPANLAPTAPAHPAALTPVHKAQPGSDTTPY